jgi:hypothetical protein
VRSITTFFAGCSLFLANAQLDEYQLDRLARLSGELDDGWTICDIGEGSFLIGGKKTECIDADLFTHRTARSGNNEGVSLYFFEKALADSIEARFQADETSTYEFIRTKTCVVVVAFLSSNGKRYDMLTRDMLKRLRNYFDNWFTYY